jgi:hypothetical protein
MGHVNYLLALMFLSGAVGLVAQPCPGLARYAGFHPPNNAASLTRVRADMGRHDQGRRNAIRAMREHGWALLQAVIAPPPGCPADPLWRTWPSLDQVFRLPNSPARIRPGTLELHIPSKILADIPAPPPPAFPSLSAVYFNRPAASHIHRLLFFDPSLLRNALLVGRRDLPEFPSGSVTIKTFWRRVPSRKGSRLRLSIWTAQDEANANGQKYPPENWTSCVNIAVVLPPGGGTTAPCIEGGGRSVSGPFYPHTDFYHVPVTETDRAQLASLLPADEQADLVEGDFLVLIGLHVAAKEMPDWVWTTFWWKPANRQVLSDISFRPADLARRGPWMNYAMNISLSMNYPDDMNGLRPAVFNPYVEGANIENGTSSNCMTCHSGASYPEVPKIPGLNTTFTDRSGPPSNAFELHIRTDYVWSFRSHAPPP